MNRKIYIKFTTLYSCISLNTLQIGQKEVVDKIKWLRQYCNYFSTIMPNVFFNFFIFVGCSFHKGI